MTLKLRKFCRRKANIVYKINNILNRQNKGHKFTCALILKETIPFPQFANWR